MGQPTEIGLVSLWFNPQGSLWVNPQREPTGIPELNDGEYDSSPRIHLAIDDHRPEKDVLATRARMQRFFVLHRFEAEAQWA